MINYLLFLFLLPLNYVDDLLNGGFQARSNAANIISEMTPLSIPGLQMMSHSTDPRLKEFAEFELKIRHRVK